MANKYWHVLHCSRPPITDKKSLSKQIYFHSYICPTTHGLGFITFIILPYATVCKVRSTNLISLIISNILLIWYLAWCHCPAAPCHNQSNCLWSSVTPVILSPPPQYWTIEQCTLGWTVLPPPPPSFPIVQRQLCVRHTSCSLSGHTG